MDTTIISNRTGLGGNNPPEQTPIDRANDLVGTANKWIAERPEITDDDMAGKAQGFIEQLRASQTATDAARAAEKKPHMDAAKAVDDRYRDPLAKLDLALRAMRTKLTAWLQEKQRKADELKRQQEAEARRLREEAEAAARAAAEKTAPVEAQLEAQRKIEQAAAAEKLAAKAPEVARVRGDFSTRATGLRTYWHARLADAADEKAAKARDTEILRHYAKNPAAREAMVKACLEIADRQAKVDKRTDTAPPGIIFYSDTKA